MKTKAVQFIFLLLSLFLMSEVKAQTVQICIKINGTTMPASKTWQMCRKNIATPTSVSSVSLAATNCAATPETNITIKWKNLSIAPYTDSLNSTIAASDTGRWEVTIVNNVTAAISKDTLHLVYFAPISVTLNDGTYSSAIYGCPLSSYTLSTSHTGSITGYNWYSYSPKLLVPGEVSSSYKIQKRNTSYIVEAHDANNCIAADTSIYFNGLTAVNIDLGPDPSVFCEGNTFAIKSTVPTGYPGAISSIQWGMNGTPLGFNNSVPTNPPPAVIVTPPAGTNKFWLVINQFPICSNADTVVITTRPIPVVSFPASPIEACYNATTTLTPTVTLSSGALSYVWSSAPTGSYPSAASINVSPTANTVYTVKVRDVNNCGDGTASVTVNVNPQIFTTLSDDTTICKDPLGTANLVATASGGNGSFTYDWTPVAGLSSTNTLTTAASILETTTYTFTATDSKNCKDTKSVTVTSYEPKVAPIVTPDIISETKSVTLEAAFAGNAGATFLWKTDTAATVLSSSSSLYIEYLGPDTVRYVVIVTDPSNGCVNKDTIEIWSISENTLMFVPNVFSPNAYSTENQTLKIYGDNLLPEGFKWLVYNKWGNLIYETTDLAKAQAVGWDGGAVAEGVYTYYIVGKFKNGKDVKESPYFKGTFTLIR